MPRLFALGIPVLIAGLVPFIPQEMELVASYQGPYAAQFGTEEYIDQVSSSSPVVIKTRPKQLGRPTYEDENGDGLVSWSEFSDRKGNSIFVQIPDATYADMGKATGPTTGFNANPRKNEYLTLFEALTPSKAEAAIAFGATNGTNGNSASVTSVTYALTTAGDDRILVIAEFLGQGTADNKTITGSTYNGVAATQAACRETENADSIIVCVSYLVAPATGANNVVTTISGTTSGGPGAIASSAAYYTGAAQTGQPDSSGSASSPAGTDNPFTVSTTVVGTGTWLVGGASENAGEIAAGSAGSGTTYRDSARNNLRNADSNGTVAAGARTLNWGRAGGSGDLAGVIISIAASASASSHSPWQFEDF